MTKEQLYRAIGDIQDAYVEEARSLKSDNKTQKAPSPWIKWGSVAACLAVVFLFVSIYASHSDRWNRDLPATETIEATEETAFGSRYVYRISDGTFAPYAGGKVIDPEYIGEKLEDVTVIAGWITEPTQSPADETLRGEVYEIKGVSPHTAAALWFLDKGDALTTTHYYVILNPTADLTPVTDYVIPDYLPDPREE